MLFSDLEDRVIAVNDSFCRMVGFTREELMGNDSKIFTYPEDIGITEDSLVRLTAEQIDQIRYTKRYLRKDGRVIVSEVSRSPARDATGKILYFVSSERDITEERALSDQLSHQALHDSLTGLANRALFEDRLDQARARLRPPGRASERCCCSTSTTSRASTTRTGTSSATSSSAGSRAASSSSPVRSTRCRASAATSFCISPMASTPCARPRTWPADSSRR